MKFCPSCGTALAGATRFCANCGAPLTAAPAARPAAGSAAAPSPAAPPTVPMPAQPPAAAAPAARPAAGAAPAASPSAALPPLRAAKRQTNWPALIVGLLALALIAGGLSFLLLRDDAVNAPTPTSTIPATSTTLQP